MMPPAGKVGAPRILLLAPNWLGDAVMTTPLLSLLSRARFGPADSPAELVLAVRRPWLSLFAEDPRLSALVPVERTGRHAGIAGIVRLARDLRARKADAVILGPPSLRAGLASFLARIPVRCGFRTDGRGPLLNTGLTFPGRGSGHYSEQLCDLGRALMARLGGRVPDRDLPPGADPLPGCHREELPGLDDGPPLWAVGVGATYGGAKVWPRERVKEFLASASAGREVRIILLGQGTGYRDDSPPGTCVREDLAGGPGVVDLVGRTSLPQVCGLLARARVFVGNDSGLMHLAAALGVPTVGLFGSSDPCWTGPLGDRTRVLAPEGFPCSPCFLQECNQPRFCLDALSATRVLAAVEDLLTAAGKEVAP